MRLLPRSPRGTWLLAAAAWVAVCVPAWQVMPALPRCDATLPNVVPHNQLLGFGPDCATAVVLRPLPKDRADRENRAALILLDTASGQPIATLVEKTALVELLGKSRDGRIWLLAESDWDGGRFSQLDLTTRKRHPLPRTPAGISQGLQARLSPDGRLAAIYEPPKNGIIGDAKTGGLILWDTVEKQDRGYLRVYPPYEFSADGRWLAAAVASGKTSHVAIVDLQTLEVRETQIPASDMPFDRGCLSDDGSYLAQYMSVGGVGLGDTDFELVCWNVASGAVVFREATGDRQPNSSRFGRVGFLGHYLVLLPKSFGSQTIRFYDLTNGGRRTEPFADDKVVQDMSPDGRFLLTMKEKSPPVPWRKILRGLGITRYLGRDEEWYGELFDPLTGRSHGIIPGKAPAFGSLNLSSGMSMDVGWSPDGRTLAVQDPSDSSVWHIWDIPPRKPLAWFAVGAAMLALPLAGLAWRRSRGLRREVA
jgi:WD40 repeat protein